MIYLTVMQLVSVATKLVVLFGHLYYKNMALISQGTALPSHSLCTFSPMEECLRHFTVFSQIQVEFQRRVSKHLQIWRMQELKQG